MSTKITVLVSCLVATLVLAGCNGGGGGESASLFGGGSGGSSSGDNIVASLFGGGGGSSTPLGGGSDPIVVSGGVSNPEPATLGLFGSGLFAYAFFKRKMKKRG